ncbi:unnamed protein product [Discula destructiva]
MRFTTNTVLFALFALTPALPQGSSGAERFGLPADSGPGTPVTQGLSAQNQELVDDGTISCVLNSNEDAVCNDASGATSIDPGA